jgi:glycosyltransferase involved in cell wall biosynthesis
MLRIIYIHQYFTTPKEAGGTRSYEKARYLVEQGHKVTMITGSRSYQTDRVLERCRSRWSVCEEIDGIDVVWVGIPFSYHRSFSWRLLGYLAFAVLSTIVGPGIHSADVVFATSTPLTVGVPGYLLSRLKGVPFVFELRDLWPEVPVALGVLRNPLLIKAARWAESFFYAKAARIIVFTQGARARLLERGLSPQKVVFISPGADVELFRPADKHNAFRAELGLDNKFVVLYAGALGLVDGLEYVLEAARILRNQPDVAFVLIGDGKEKENLISLKEHYGLSNVIFVPARPKEQIPAVVAAADVGLMPVRNLKIFEMACPNKLFDYMACGRPVLVNVAGEFKELLEAGDAGLYVSPDDPQAMAAAILSLKADPARCERMGRNARLLAERDYDRRNQAKKLEALLVEVVREARND